MRTSRFPGERPVASALATRPGASFAESVAVDASDALGALASARDARLLRGGVFLARDGIVGTRDASMRLDRAGTYVVEYRIGGTTRGVLDTGSPFITMESACGVGGAVCARRTPGSGSRTPTGLRLAGGRRHAVLGDVAFAGKRRTRRRTPAAFVRGRRSNDGNFDALLARPARLFRSLPELASSATSQTGGRAGVAAGGVGAPCSWACETARGLDRPTFLEQTDVASFVLDFEKDELLTGRVDSRCSQKRFPLVDLRRWARQCSTTP